MYKRNNVEQTGETQEECSEKSWKEVIEKI